MIRLGAPCVAVVGCENLRSPEHVVEVVHRLALAHKHDVCQLVALGQRVYLIKYVGGCEAALKALLAGLAEQAVHLASHLRRHAQRGAVFVGYVNRLDKLTALRREQIFYRSVNRLLAVGLGALITAILHSSGATTVMVVGFVNAGILNLTQAVGVIMGANIGTTITAWMVSLNSLGMR